jgi:hypothetical protein
MAETQVQEQIRSLRSQNADDRLRAATRLGKLGPAVRETDETLASDYHGAIVSLAWALRDQESPLIRAEAAWALGRIGGLAAMRRLLPRIEELMPAPGAGAQVLGQEAPAQEEPASARAALIAAAGRALSVAELATLDTRDIASLAQARELLLRQLDQETDDDVRVAITETVVALSVRARRAGLDIPTDLSALLCRGDRDAVLAAIALLREILPNAPEIAARWHERAAGEAPGPAVEQLIEAWGQQLEACRPERSEILEWLDLAATVWDLQKTAELAA